ncbi:hypothetical protein, partial [Streptomyces stelliscabiei]|uniref:hypothetical protein n=1 Tax=Streptomyces stelliscabiei TaxID=146820 RepID=UPI001ABF2AEC
MTDVRPQLDELLFSSVEGVSVESVEVTDLVVRVEARRPSGGRQPGTRLLIGLRTRFLPTISPRTGSGRRVRRGLVTGAPVR